MKGNKDICHTLFCIDKTVQENTGTARINNSKYEKLSGIKIDCKLNFDDHEGNICKKAGAKSNILTRVAQYMNTEKSALLRILFFRRNLIIVPLHEFCAISC